jgi:hypothetical protein
MNARIDTRLESLLPEGERIVARTRAWVSRDGRMHGWFAARTRDFAVVGNRGLYLASTGFFTRRPRRRVYAMPLDRLQVADRQAKRGHRLAIASGEHRPLLLEMRRTAEATAFVDALTATTTPARGHS